MPGNAKGLFLVCTQGIIPGGKFSSVRDARVDTQVVICKVGIIPTVLPGAQGHTYFTETMI